MYLFFSIITRESRIIVYLLAFEICHMKLILKQLCASGIYFEFCAHKGFYD